MVADAYNGPTAFVIGRTGFKGSWLCLWLGAQLAGQQAKSFAEAWNFAPQPADVRSVGVLVGLMLAAWSAPGWHDATEARALGQAGLLRQSIVKAVTAHPQLARQAKLADLDAHPAGAAALGLPLAA